MSDQNEIKNSHNHFSVIPNVIREMGLDAYSISAYLILMSYAGKIDSCYPSNKTIASKMKSSVPTYLKARETLCKKGLIKVTERKKDNNSPDTSLIEILDIWKKNIDFFAEGGSKGGLLGVVKEVYEGSKGGLLEEDIIEEDHKKEIYKEKNKLGGKDPKPQQKKLLKVLSEDERNELYKLYGKKIIDSLEKEILTYPETFNRKQKFVSVDLGIRNLATKRQIAILNPPNFNDNAKNDEILKQYKIIESRLLEIVFPELVKIRDDRVTIKREKGILNLYYKDNLDIELLIQKIRNECNKKTQQN